MNFSSFNCNRQGLLSHDDDYDDDGNNDGDDDNPGRISLCNGVQFAVNIPKHCSFWRLWFLETSVCDMGGKADSDHVVL
jgi:hypothetical protein